MAEIKEALNHYWQHLLNFPNVLNVAAGTKIKNGQDTKIPAVVVYVSKKVNEVELPAEGVIPKDLAGVPTDVVEIAPKTWKAGKTAISQLPPEEQLKRLGAHVSTITQTSLSPLMTTQPSGQSDWTAYANPIQDQHSCGSCVAFDITGVWEALIKIRTGDTVKLSESHLFFCGGGRCSYGSIVATLLNQAMKGVCLESCLPYSGKDETCGEGICANWWLNAKKLSSWETISDPTQILIFLDSGPLVATMAVPQSFFNYTEGIYTRLPNDPIVGHHGVGIFGYSLNCYKILRNSWGPAWGQNCTINGIARPGWCMIEPSLLDGVMFFLVPDGAVPEPDPSPSPCKTASVCTKPINWILKKTGHEGRLFYGRKA